MGVKNERLVTDMVIIIFSSVWSTNLLVILGRRIMNQKFGDLFQKFLIIFLIWNCISFMFGIGY